jgi:hypothetical protein
MHHRLYIYIYIYIYIGLSVYHPNSFRNKLARKVLTILLSKFYLTARVRVNCKPAVLEFNVDIQLRHNIIAPSIYSQIMLWR